MTITIDVSPEVKAALACQVAAQGRAVESYAASLLEQAVHPTAAPPTPPAKDMIELLWWDDGQAVGPSRRRRALRVS
jgi:hypothetical protein